MGYQKVAQQSSSMCPSKQGWCWILGEIKLLIGLLIKNGWCNTDNVITAFILDLSALRSLECQQCKDSELQAKDLNVFTSPP